ncbi:MAG: TrmH family RNA methyltransferase, partial [Ilumatobacteraceae bacterium]
QRRADIGKRQARRRWGRRSARSETGTFVVEGPTLIREAVAAGWDVVGEFVAPSGVPVSTAPSFELAAGVLERIATTDRPQPNLAVVRIRPATVDLAAASMVVVVDQLADPGNLGTILRSAEAAGADVVVLTPGSVDAFNPKVVRASAGAIFRVPVVEADLDEVRAARCRIIGTSSHLGVSHVEADWGGRFALVMGNEAHGLPDSTDVDAWVRIEHRGRSESLNVAMAATVLLFEAARHRS